MGRRIGVLTFHYAVNYGAVLQTYAMVEFLTRQGHDVNVIDYRSPKIRRYVLRAVSGSRWRPVPMARDVARYLLFMRFLKRRLKLTRTSYDRDNPVDANGSRFDALITGSDQVWNTKLFGYEPAYFLNFADPETTRLVSYAPSAGLTDDWGEYNHDIAKMLGRFDAISVRDRLTGELVQRCAGIEPVHTVDPTFLGDFSAICGEQARSDRYIFVYAVGRSEVLDDWVTLIKKKVGMKAVVVGAPCPTADERHVAVSPGRWLDMIRGASMVVTNSFHGTIFSILNRRPFLVAPQKTGNTRVQDLLARIGGRERLLPDVADEAHLPQDFLEVDWEAMHGAIKQQVERSAAFLTEAVAGDG